MLLKYEILQCLEMKLSMKDNVLCNIFVAKHITNNHGTGVIYKAFD